VVVVMAVATPEAVMWWTLGRRWPWR